MKNLRSFKEEIKSLFDINFDRIDLKKLRDKTFEACKHNDEIGAYKLNVACDIKELMSDKYIDRQDFNFYVNSLLILYFKE